MGCDWIFVDCEHGNISTDQLSGLLCAAPASVSVLVRIPANEEIFVKQALDAGCGGVICPKVESPVEAERLVRWAKYPPLGERSVGIARAHGYGLEFDNYVSEANTKTSVVVQIETVRGVEELARILGVEGLGGVFIGPYDLSGSMGVPGRVDAPTVQRIVIEVVKTCKKTSTPVGQFFGTEVDFIKCPHRDDLDFVAIGLDTSILAHEISSSIAMIGDSFQQGQAHKVRDTPNHPRSRGADVRAAAAGEPGTGRQSAQRSWRVRRWTTPP